MTPRARPVLGWSRLLLAVLALLVVGPAPGPGPARAQEFVDIPTRRGDRVRLRVEFGWNGRLTPERWSPVVVWVSGDEPIDGVLEVSYPQDATQAARVLTPFAVTPGLSTPIEVYVCVPAALDELTITLRSPGGRELKRAVLSTRTPGAALLPPMAEGSRVLVGVCAAPSLSRAASSWREWWGGPGASPQRADPAAISLRPTDRFHTGGLNFDSPEAFGLIDTAPRGPERLPTAWPGYDGLSALVVGADAPASDEAARAVRAWVERGGCLVVLADGPGEGWRRWLPEGWGAALELDPPARLPAPARARTVLEEWRRWPTSDAGPATTPDAPEGDAPGGEPASDVAPTGEAPVVPGLDELLPTGREVSGRRVRVTEAGAGEGWSALWGEDDRVGLGATGPAGLGRVVVLGVDPERVPAVLAPRAAAALWRDALAGSLRRALSDAITEQNTAGAWYNAGSGRSDAERRLISGVLDTLVDAPAVGWSAFYVIAGAGLFLALAVGPLDMVWLRRAGLMHRSWASALGWVGLASLGAFVVPGLLRTHPTTLTRATVIDAVHPAERAPGRPVAWRWSATGVFAGEDRTLRLTGVPDDAWARGVSALTSYRGMSEQRFGRSLLTPQPPASPGEPRGGAVRALGLGVWTFRAYTDESPAIRWPSPRFELAPEGESGAIVLDGFRPDERVVAASVTRDLQEIGLRFARAGEGVWRLGLFDTPPSEPARGVVLAGDSRVPTSDRARTPGWVTLRVWTESDAPALGVEGGGVIVRERTLYRVQMPADADELNAVAPMLVVPEAEPTPPGAPEESVPTGERAPGAEAEEVGP